MAAVLTLELAEKSGERIGLVFLFFRFAGTGGCGMGDVEVRAENGARDGEEENDGDCDVAKDTAVGCDGECIEGLEVDGVINKFGDVAELLWSELCMEL